MLIRQYVALLLLRAGARTLWRLIKVMAAAAVIIAAAPVSLVTAGAAVTAWACGWPPRRLYGAALWCLPMVAVWLAAAALAAPGSPGVPSGPAWYRVAGAPYDAWLSMWRLGVSGQVAHAAVMIAPAAVPLGLLTGGLAWAVRIYRMETGTGGLSPGSAISFDRRQWRRQARSARARIAAPGSVPLTYRNGDVVIGGTIRAVRHPAKPIAAVPYARLRSHQVVIGTTGTGKPVLRLTDVSPPSRTRGRHGRTGGRRCTREPRRADSGARPLRNGHRTRPAQHVVKGLRAASTDHPPDRGQDDHENG